MKIQNLVLETSEIALNLNQGAQSSSLMAIDAHSIVGGDNQDDQIGRGGTKRYRTYVTAIETSYSNGNVGAETTTDTPEPGDSLT